MLVQGDQTSLKVLWCTKLCAYSRKKTRKTTCQVYYLVQRDYKWLKDPHGTASSVQSNLWPIQINTEIKSNWSLQCHRTSRCCFFVFFCAALLVTQGCIGAEDRMSSQQLYSLSLCPACPELLWELARFPKRHRAAAINTFKLIFTSLKIF